MAAPIGAAIAALSLTSSFRKLAAKQALAPQLLLLLRNSSLGNKKRGASLFFLF